MKRLVAIVLLLILWAQPCLASNQARSFPGGAATDNLVTGSTLTGTQQVSAYFRLNITSLDATTRRPFDWADGSVALLSLIVSNVTFTIVANQYATSGGAWTIAGLSTGAEHDLLITMDYGNVANAPVAYVDGSSVTVSLSTAPVGAFSAQAKVLTVGNRFDLTRSFNGWVSMVAIWTGILLSSTDATNLHNGQSPCVTSVANLAFFAPLDNGDSPESELVKANNLTVTGSTVVTGSSAFANAHCASFRTLMGVGQ
jgi:hypothetical protein